MARPGITWLASVLVLGASFASAQPAYLVRDITTDPGTGGPSPTSAIVAGGRLFFAGIEEAGGTEPWTSDGTAAGTHLVVDLSPGSSGPRDFVEMGGLAYFVAADPGRGTEIWRTDGTVAGTLPATNLAGVVAPFLLTRVGPVIYFSLANDAVVGDELWKTDGTPAGTSLVRDIVPGPGSSGPQELVAAGSTLFFVATNPSSGLRQVWKSDGTVPGTVPLGNGPAGPQDPRRLSAVGSTLYFEARDAVHGNELWKSDGTDAGTVLVRDISPGTESSFPEQLTAVGSLLYFAAGDPGAGHELWKSDGTAAGTVMVADVAPGADSSLPRGLVAAGNRVFFAAETIAEGSEPWVSDGTAAGTYRLGDLEPGANGSYFGKGAAVGDQFFFRALTSACGGELWTSDGTAAGTRLVADLIPGDPHSMPDALVAWAGLLYFTASTPESSRPLWRTDGTASGTVVVGPAPPLSKSSAITFVGAAGSSLAFGVSPSNGLWLSDGTEAGTAALPSTPPPPCAAPLPGDALFFAGNDASFGDELWATDGTPAGTCRVSDVVPGPADSNITFVGTVGARVFFQDDFSVNGPRLFVADRTVPVPSLVVTGPRVTVGAAFQDELFFADSFDLWRSDGTPSGTRVVSHVRAVSLMPTPTLLYFVAPGPQGVELWKTDGTPAGTSMVADICPGTCDAFPNMSFQETVDHAVIGSILYFVADDGTHGREVWRTDGTAAGTTMLADVSPAPFSLPGCLTELAGTLLFCADDGVTGREVWRSDGTTVGTVRVTDVDPGVGFGVPIGGRGQFYRAGGFVYFMGYTRALGIEPWRTDGTPGGTVLLQDVSAGPSSSWRFLLAAQAAGQRLFFLADDGLHGRELWATELAPSLAVGDTTIVEGDAGAVTALVEVRATSAPSATATVAYATVNGTAQAGPDYTPATGTLTFQPGGPTVQTVALAVAGDLAQEVDETFALQLSAAAGIGVGRDRGTVVILDDDEPRVSIADGSVVEGDAGDVQAQFQVRVTTADGSATVTPTGVAFETSEVTASSAFDYATTAGTVTFPPGTPSGSTQLVTVAVHGDTVPEADETFEVRIVPLTAASALDSARGWIADDDGAPGAAPLGLAHGSVQVTDLGAQAGPSADTDWYTLPSDGRSSYEVVVDEVSGDVQPLTLELMNEQGSLPSKVSVPVGTGGARSLRFESATPLQRIRVTSGGCGTACGADDTYRIRAYETTYAIPRVITSETLSSALIVQNRTDRPVFASVYFWSAAGVLVAGDGRSLLPRESAVIPVPASVSGSATVTHDGGYGALAGKAVTVDVVTGASYDTPMEPLRR